MSRNAFILIVTPDAERGARLRELLRGRYKHPCRVVTSLDQARESIQARVPDVVVAEGELDGRAAGEALVEVLDAKAKDATLVLVGQNGAPPQAQHVEVSAVPKLEDAEDLLEPISQAAAGAVARRDDRLFKQSLERQKLQVFHGIVGATPPIQRIIERIKKAARNKLTVLLLGETGTGKELIARAIHDCSERAAKPFFAINCAGVSETLVESELFGHVKGAFTGAVSDKKGLFVAADGGTLFLDEIGDMPLPMQAKLLRVLETREVTPVGSHELRRVDVRVIAATNSDLRGRIDDKQFREDLYYRLNQWVIHVPPLRERRDDIPLLAVYLLEQANAEHGADVPGFSSDALRALTRYPWPGNVRELANVINRVVVEVEDRQIKEHDLPEEVRGSREMVRVSGSQGLVGLTLDQIERIAIERTLAAVEGNREQAAKMLNIGTRTLYRKLKEYDIR
jgi:DNA-binding NtrC family response regulator